MPGNTQHLFTNAQARTFEEYTGRQRRPSDVGRLCWNGYHLPHFREMQCEMVGCRCYCHHPKEVEAYRFREGKCRVCTGTGRLSATRDDGTSITADCYLCFGSGYGPGHPATMKPTLAEQKQQAKIHWVAAAEMKA